VAQRVEHRTHAAGDQEDPVPTRWEQPPERQVARVCDRRVVREEQQPVEHADREHEARVQRKSSPRSERRTGGTLDPPCDLETASPLTSISADSQLYQPVNT